MLHTFGLHHMSYTCAISNASSIFLLYVSVGHLAPQWDLDEVCYRMNFQNELTIVVSAIPISKQYEENKIYSS